MQCREKEVVWEHSKGLAQVQGDDINCLPVVHQCQHCITEGTRWIRHGLPLAQPCWLSQITSSSLSCLHTSSGMLCSMISNTYEVAVTFALRWTMGARMVTVPSRAWGHSISSVGWAGGHRGCAGASRAGVLSGLRGVMCLGSAAPRLDVLTHVEAAGVDPSVLCFVWGHLAVQMP